MAAQKQWGVIRPLLQALKLVARDEMPPEITRALGLWQLRDAVSEQLHERGYSLNDLFSEGADQFAIAYKINENGDYYRVTSTLWQFPITNDGVTVSVGEPVQVKLEFTSVAAEREFTVFRDADNVRRWFAIISTATINRDKQIDSTKLYDHMIARAEKIGYPYVTLYHKGETYKIGNTDGLSRNGYCYVASGTFDTGELPDHVVRSIEDDPSYWGVSIGFNPTKPPTVERIGNTRIPIYNEGDHIEISFLPVKDACSLFTNISVERSTMTDKFQEMLAHVFKGKPELIEKYGGMVKTRNAEIETQGLVTRDTTTPAPDATPQADAPKAETTPPTTSAKPDEKPADVQIDLTPEALQQIGAAVVGSQAFQDLFGSVTRVVSAVAEVAGKVDALEKTIPALSDRIAPLERTDAEKQRAILQDQPRASRITLAVAPSQTRSADPNVEKKTEKIPTAANNPLSGI